MSEALRMAQQGRIAARRRRQRRLARRERLLQDAQNARNELSIVYAMFGQGLTSRTLTAARVASWLKVVTRLVREVNTTAKARR